MGGPVSQTLASLASKKLCCYLTCFRLCAHSLVLLCALFFASTSGYAASALGYTVENPLEVLTENWPPFNYERDGRVSGLSTEVVKATLERAGIPYTIRLGIWKPLYERALNEHNVLIYTITRTAAREGHFEWIGPIAERQQNLFKLKGRDDIVINSLEDAKRYRIGVQAEDAITQDLIAKGFDPEGGNFQLFSKRVLAYRMLFAGRVDLVTGHDITVKYQLELEGLPYDNTEIAFEIEAEGSYYMALKKGSDPALVKAIKQAFQQIQDTGVFFRIKSKYR